MQLKIILFYLDYLKENQYFSTNRISRGIRNHFNIRSSLYNDLKRTLGNYLGKLNKALEDNGLISKFNTQVYKIHKKAKDLTLNQLEKLFPILKHLDKTKIFNKVKEIDFFIKEDNLDLIS